MINEIGLTEKVEDANEEYITKDLFVWLRSIPFYIGLLKGLNLCKTYGNDAIPAVEFYLPENFRDIKYRWSVSYGKLRIHLDFFRSSFDYLSEYRFGYDWEIFHVDTLDNRHFYSKEYLLYLYTKIDNTIHKFLTGIVQVNGYRPCSLCTKPDSLRYFNICTPLGDKWLCDDCMNRYSLPSPVEFKEHIQQNGKRTFSEEQRAKMTPALRYSILERDEFKCRICGRSPLQDDDIKLEVDHIKPIFKGGLTEPDNLWVLCQECNRGKGVKTFWTDPAPQQQEIIKGDWFGNEL